MSRLGTLITRLKLDNSGLKKGALDAEVTLDRLGTRARAMTTKAAKLTAGLVAAGAALTTALTRQGLKAVDAQAKLARSLDATADGVRAVQIAAGDFGVDGLEQSLTRLNRRLGAVEMEGGPALETIEALSLSAEELSQMDADDRMAAIADAIKETGMSSQESARHLQQLGFTQAEANDFFRQGGDAIRAARAEVEDYGLSLSEVDSAQVEAANDAFSRIGRTIEVLRQRLAVQLAPFIEYVSDLFNDATREAGGFRDQIDDGITGAIRIGTKFLDVIEGIRRTFLVAGQGIATAMIGIQTTILNVATTIMEGPIRAINLLIDAANAIPGVDIDTVVQPDFIQGARNRVDQLKRAFDEGKKDIDATLMEPLPSSGLEERLQEIRDRSREAAEQVVADRERMAAPISGEIMDEGAEQMDEAHREQLARRLERLQESMMEEQELLEHKHEQQLEELRAFKDAELLTEEEYAELSEQLAAKHQDKLTALLESGEEDRNRAISRFAAANQAIRDNSIREEASNLRAGLQTMFGDTKAASTAMAGLKRLEAISSAYAWGSSFGGPPAGAAAAAAAAAAQLSNLRNVQSASFSGGTGNVGGVEGSASMGAQVAPQQQQGPQQTTVINLQGDSFGQRQVREMLESMSETMRDGGRLVVT